MGKHPEKITQGPIANWDASPGFLVLISGISFSDLSLYKMAHLKDQRDSSWLFSPWWHNVEEYLDGLVEL